MIPEPRPLQTDILKAIEPMRSLRETLTAVDEEPWTLEQMQEMSLVDFLVFAGQHNIRFHVERPSSNDAYEILRMIQRDKRRGYTSQPSQPEPRALESDQPAPSDDVPQLPDELSPL
jgi:hypothetical protein